MAFRYPLQSLLRLQESLERQEENRLFAIAAEVARLRNQIEEFNRDQLEARRSELNELASGTSAATLQFSNLCDGAASAARSAFDRELQAAERRRLAQLSVYQAARQKREILQGLRERHESAYDLATAHREQQNLDDAFLRIRPTTDE